MLYGLSFIFLRCLQVNNLMYETFYFDVPSIPYLISNSIEHKAAVHMCLTDGSEKQIELDRLKNEKRR